MSEIDLKKYKDKILRTGNYPGFTLINHPRRFNKPLSCQSGLHRGLVTRMISGVPSLYCTKCGGHIGQGIHDKTWSKQEIHKIAQIKAEASMPKSKEDSLKQSWEALEMLRKRGFTDEQIRKMMNERMEERKRKGLRYG